MEVPSTQKMPYYVYGIWNIYNPQPLVSKGDGPEVHEFDELDDALSFIKTRAQQNVNITWCLTMKKESITFKKD